MLIEKDTGEPIGIRTNRFTWDGEVFDPTLIKQDAVRYTVLLCIRGTERVDFFKRYGTTQAFHFFGLATAHAHMRKGVTLDMIRNLGIGTVFAKGEATSKCSQKIYKEFGFEELFNQPYATFEVDGKFIFQDTGKHKSFKVYGLKVS
ncbi:hypothetical protein MAR_027017 [Mya arenaria]|uniref:Uncharacterized protein n=1 Tax=Mya arenaria TaxID=6604 RepID=A0ABY7EV82_MYAAR|nr:hypothetical protein MAR_027017 [Mya arenaria]